jgi:hypothetical protein
MRRRVAIALGLFALAALAAAAHSADVRTSSAGFTTTSSSRLEATAARVSGWLHLYSRDTDPYGDTGYADQVGNTNPAATGQDESIVVDFVIPGNGNYPHNRVLKVRTPAAFPDVSPDPLVTAVTVTVTVTPDPSTGLQPISKYGVDVWAAAPTYTKTITGWGVGVQRQLNLQTKFPGKKYGPGLYTPSVVLTLTYTGMTATFYQYSIPIRIQYR